MKVAYLGPKGTFSHEACNIYFKTEELFGYKTITDTRVLQLGFKKIIV